MYKQRGRKETFVTKNKGEIKHLRKPKVIQLLELTTRYFTLPCLKFQINKKEINTSNNVESQQKI